MHGNESEELKARLAVLERHLAKKSAEVKDLKEQLVNWDPDMAQHLSQLKAELSQAAAMAGRADAMEAELAEARQRGFGLEHEVAQLQKQRRHLERRLAEEADKAERLRPKDPEKPEEDGEFAEDNPQQVCREAHHQDEFNPDAAYADLLQEAYNSNSRAVEALKFIGVTAKDVQEHPVVVIAPGTVSRRFKIRDVCMYMLRFFEDLELFESPYDVVLCDSDIVGCIQIDDVEQLIQIARALPSRATRHLSSLWILHPGRQAKVVMAAFQAAGFKAHERVACVETVAELCDVMWKRRIVLPDYVYSKENKSQTGGLGHGLQHHGDMMVKTRKMLWDETIHKQQQRRRYTLLQRDRESLIYFKEQHAELQGAERWEEAGYVEQDIAALEQEIAELEFLSQGSSS
eukprot:TRINITY_DN36014_c0_g1_i3.p1 TRINITY_DN36014_c0_g1~~TRINITY_DN36014_c0_g1_i3.p1  ORF type:complete len:403 (+),score=128.15 TRINITY_DN36014_c0_g1_i3:395-1603(+)